MRNFFNPTVEKIRDNTFAEKILARWSNPFGDLDTPNTLRGVNKLLRELQADTYTYRKRDDRDETVLYILDRAQKILLDKRDELIKNKRRRKERG